MREGGKEGGSEGRSERRSFLSLLTGVLVSGACRIGKARKILLKRTPKDFPKLFPHGSQTGSSLPPLPPSAALYFRWVRQ